MATFGIYNTWPGCWNIDITNANKMCRDTFGDKSNYVGIDYTKNAQMRCLTSPTGGGWVAGRCISTYTYPQIKKCFFDGKFGKGTQCDIGILNPNIYKQVLLYELTNNIGFISPAKNLYTTHPQVPGII